MSWSSALLTNALLSTPATSLPPTVYVSHTSKFLVINDLYPKSTYHYLILPRLPFPLKDGSHLTEHDLTSLQAFVKGVGGSEKKKKVVLEVLEGLEEMVEVVEERMRERMRREKGFEWEVVWGFHAVPSMKVR